MLRERLYPPDWLDTDTAAYMVSMSIDTFLRRVDDGTFPRPVTIGGKRLWSRIRLNERLDRLDPAFDDGDDPIMTALRAQAAQRSAGHEPAGSSEFKTHQRSARRLSKPLSPRKA